jgi:hypothetical protein
LEEQPELTAIMDFPEAWAFVKETRPEDHHERCSWRTERGAFLCDCHVLNDEYARREAEHPHLHDPG